MSAAINFSRKLDLIKEHWTPKVIAQMNDYQFKLVKVQGDFVWHSHADTDETFIVLEGELRIDLRDGAVTLGPGEMGRGAARRRAQTACRARGLCSADRALRGAQHRRWRRGRERTAPNDVDSGDGVPVGSRAGARSSGAGRTAADASARCPVSNESVQDWRCQ